MHPAMKSRRRKKGARQPETPVPLICRWRCFNLYRDGRKRPWLGAYDPFNHTNHINIHARNHVHPNPSHHTNQHPHAQPHTYTPLLYLLMDVRLEGRHPVGHGVLDGPFHVSVVV